MGKHTATLESPADPIVRKPKSPLLAAIAIVGSILYVAVTAVGGGIVGCLIGAANSSVSTPEEFWTGFVLGPFVVAILIGLIGVFNNHVLRHPGIYGTVMAFEAGQDIAEGDLFGAAINGAGAYQLAQVSAQQQGQEWVGGLTPQGSGGGGWSPTPELLAIGAGVAYGSGRDRRLQRQANESIIAEAKRNNPNSYENLSKRRMEQIDAQRQAAGLPKMYS